MIKSGPTATTSLDSFIIASTNLESFLDCLAMIMDSSDGIMSPNLITLPSAFEINVSAIKIISPCFNKQPCFSIASLII